MKQKIVIKNIRERRSYLDETNLQNNTIKVIVSAYRWLVGNLRLWSIIPNVSSFEFIHCKSRYIETVR